MRDITERLRLLYVENGYNYVQEAADEIERLRKERDDLQGWRMRVHDELIVRRIMTPDHLGAPFKGVTDLIAHVASSAISDGAKWIPLSERSPEPEVDVLLVDYRGNRCVGYKRKEGRGWSVPAGCLYVEPNHWMPLPEAPK